MEKVLKDYGRYLLLQSQLSGLEQETEAARRCSLAAEREKSQRNVEWECLKKPGFIQRLLGRAEEKKDDAYRAWQAADASWKTAVQAWEQAAQTYESVKEELGSLSDAPERFAKLSKTQELRVLAVAAFRPAAQYNLNMVLSSLEQALQWENRERNVGGRLPSQDDGMWEHLALAREPARKLKYILEQFPEPESWVCDYLKNPDGFIYDGVIMKISSRNKIRVAIGQMQRLKEKLH